MYRSIATSHSRAILRCEKDDVSVITNQVSRQLKIFSTSEAIPHPRRIWNMKMMQRHCISIPGSGTEPSSFESPTLRVSLRMIACVAGLCLGSSAAVAQSPPPTAHHVDIEAVSLAQGSSPRQQPMAAESRPTKRRKPAKSQRGTLTGARLIPFRSQAVRATLGFPDIELAYHFPYTPEIELIPRLQVAYGRNLSTSPSIMEFGSDARKEIYRKGKWAVAGFASSFIHLNMNSHEPVHYGPTGGFGLGLGCPGVFATYAHNKDFDINFGAQLQNILYLGDSTALELNMPLSVGFEYAFSKKVRLVQRTEFGPDIYVSERTDLHLRTYLGAGYSF